MISNELRARIYAAYMPCKITDKYANGVHYDMVGVSEYEGMLQVKMTSGDSDWWNINICQLILTPLSDITDDDAVEVCRLAKTSNGDAAMGKSLIIDYWNRVSNVRACEWIKIIDFLRSKSYDVGYGNIPSLIKAGIAVSK